MGISQPTDNVNGLTHSLHRASQFADDLFAEAVDDKTLTARQLVVLEIVGRQAKLSQTEICAQSGIDRSTMADMIGRMVRKGYVMRRRSRADSRRYAVQLTEKGREAMEKALPHARNVEERVAGVLTAKQRQLFFAALQRILDASEARGLRS
ncbi:MAG: MarR family winged helix-turn-helix transcriptional regulator [Hyphomicrobium sp.]